MWVECCAPASSKLEDPSEWQPLPTTRRKAEHANASSADETTTGDGHADANGGLKMAQKILWLVVWNMELLVGDFFPIEIGNINPFQHELYIFPIVFPYIGNHHPK